MIEFGSCCCGGAYSTGTPEYTKEVKMEFDREEILQDLRTLGYVEGDTMQTADEHDRHQVTDIAEAGNVEWVTRQMDLVMSHCAETLYPFTKKLVKPSATVDNEYDEADVYTILMKVPDDFSETTLEYLKNLIHHLVVATVMAEWMRIANKKNPESATKWLEQAERYEADIDSALYARMRRVRRPKTPF